ncbi:MAG: YfhO family protein [Candidatus Hydrogenedentes bacterium]|nr:YfhO family protein [Candidatus Hydrogenedentota bacterium]
MFRLRYRAALERGLCLAALILAAAGALYPIVFQGRVPVSTDAILSLTPWEQARPADVAAVEDPQPSATARRLYPWFVFLHDTVQRGDSLLWNPCEACGLPFLALWRSRCLSPFSIPFYLLPPPTALQLAALLKVLAAGLCGFYVARRLGFALPIALFVGLCLELSGPILLWIDWPLADAVVWLPFLVLFADRVATAQFRTWPLGALVFCLMLLGGDPETAVAAFVYAGLYIAFRHLFATARQAPGHRRLAGIARPVGVLALTAAAGLALCALQVIPYLEFRMHAAATGREGSGAALRLLHLLACILPRYFGNAVSPGDSASPEVLGLLYGGLVPLALLPLWLATRPFAAQPQRNRIDALLVAGCTMGILALLVRPGAAGLPGLAWLDPKHLLVPAGLTLALVAAAAIEQWLELDADACVSALKRLLLAAPAFVAAAAVLIVVNGPGTRPGAPSFAVQAWLAGGCAVAVFALTAVALLRPSVRVLGYGLCVLTAIDLFMAFQAAMPMTDREHLFPETPFVASLRESGARVSGTPALQRWPLSGNLIPQVYASGGAALDRHAAFVARVDDDPLLLRRAGSPALLLTKDDIQGPFAAVRPLLRVQHVFASGAVLFEDLASKPRIWMAYDGRPVADFNPDELDSGLPPLMERIRIPDDKGPPRPMGELVASESNTRLQIRLDAPRSGVLVVADSWYPGWRASVDGQEAAIGVVDGVFRGIPLEEGEHEVVFRYEPGSFKAGLIVSLAAAIVILTGLVPLIVKGLRKRERWPSY